MSGSLTLPQPALAPGGPPRGPEGPVGASAG